MINRDLFLYRSYLALRKFGVVRDEIGPNSAAQLRPLLRLLAFLQASASKKEAQASELEQELSQASFENNSDILVTAMIFYSAEKFEAALRTLHMAASDDLEAMALRLQTLLKMDRVDLARKELKAMQDTDDDATLTQLAQVIIFKIIRRKIFRILVKGKILTMLPWILTCSLESWIMYLNGNETLIQKLYKFFFMNP